MTITPAQIADLRRLREAATPGEWYFGPIGMNGLECLVFNLDDEDVPVLAGPELGADQIDNNWDLVAAAANLALPLCDTIEEERAENKRLSLAIRLALNDLPDGYARGVLSAALERKAGE